MIVSNIVVTDKNSGIGKNNQLLIHFPADLKRFKKITSGHTIIMGRKTYDSMGKALPNRRNIVISRQENLRLADAEVVSSLTEALELSKGQEEVFIIGGAEIFRQALPLSQRIYLTAIHHRFDADTFFPELNMQEWKEAEKEDHQAGDQAPFPYSFITYEKR